MFDRNEFKKKVKDWIKNNPQGDEQDLIDYCDEIIPPNQFSANQWLIDHTISWYKHVLSSRENARKYCVEDDDHF